MGERFHQRMLFPFLMNPLSFVEVTTGQVRWQHGLIERFALPIETVQTRLDAAPGLWSQIVGSGDVVIIDAGVEYRVPNVLRGRALRERITRQRTFSDEAAHTHGQSDPPLEDYVICIPQPPTLVVDAVWEISRARAWAITSAFQAERQVKRQGDWVMKGETIAFLGAPIVAPVAGRIRMMGGSYGHCGWPDGADWPQHDDEYFHTLAKIQPVKGSDTDGYVDQAYNAVFRFLEKQITQERVLKRMAARSLSPLATRLGGHAPIADYLRKTMNNVRGAKPRIETVAVVGGTTPTDEGRLTLHAPDGAG
jgi:hypothetical protein